MVGMTQHLHCVLCHLRGEKEPWAKSCPDLLLVASLSLGEAVPSTGTPLCSWGCDRACSQSRGPFAHSSSPQPLPSTGDDLQQHLLGSELRNGQLTSTAGEGCHNSVGPWGQLFSPALGASCCSSAPVTVLLSARTTGPPDPRQLPPWRQGLLPPVLAA